MSADEVRLRDWLLEAQFRLKTAGVDTPELDAQLLAASALGWARSEVLVRGDFRIQRPPLDRLLERRLRREPLAYISGHREFYGLDFAVSPDVLVPRPETEILVEVAIDWIKQDPGPARIVDLGTGSGCIAVALARSVSVPVVAIDVSPAALRIARSNAAAHGVSIEFVEADGIFWLESALPTDLIVTNPPYVGRNDPLPPEVRDHEPDLALFAGADGLEFYRRLAAISTRPPTLTEIGQGQEDAVIAEFANAGWRHVEAREDYAGIVRVLGFRP